MNAKEKEKLMKEKKRNLVEIIEMKIKLEKL